MSLNQEQLETVKRWVAEGSSISDVQSKLKDEYGVVMTYIDVRFLIDDLGAELISPQVEATPELNDTPNGEIADNPTSDIPQSPETFDNAPSDDFDNPTQEQQSYSEQETQVSNVKVTVSPIQRPDCIISGDVEFSDGSKAEWRIDRMGQLGIIPSNPAMNPPQSDIMEFQRQLQQLLR